MGRLNESIRGGEGNYVGHIFQEAWHRLFGGKWVDTYEYDIELPEPTILEHPTHCGKIETKAKERTLPEIDNSWEVSVADNAGKGTNQLCDIYAFGSISVNHSKEPMWIWFLGWLPKKEFLQGRRGNELQEEGELDCKGRLLTRWEGLKDGAEFRKKGLSYDENGFVCSEDCWNRRIDYLNRYKLTDLDRRGRDQLQSIILEARREGWGGRDRYLLGKGEFD